MSSVASNGGVGDGPKTRRPAGRMTLGEIVTDAEPQAWCEALFGPEWWQLDAWGCQDELASRIGGEALELHREKARLRDALSALYPAGLSELQRRAVRLTLLAIAGDGPSEPDAA